MAPVSLHWNDGTPENVVVLPCLKSMTWAMENKNSAPGNRVAVINLKVLLYIYLFTTFFCVSMIAVCVGADDSLHLIFEL
ncbi:protein FAR1-RELATED SEQUENCE 3-like [Prunus persica]|nr:protein FAR1-RELATED SEQUENCE 3-like [Prunus persica]